MLGFGGGVIYTVKMSVAPRRARRRGTGTNADEGANDRGGAKETSSLANDVVARFDHRTRVTAMTAAGDVVVAGETNGRVSCWRVDDGALVSYLGRCPDDGVDVSTRGVPVFVNGLSNACFQLTPFADAALTRGRAVLEWDMRGHGCSENPRSYDTVSARSFAKDAWAVVDDFVGVSERRDVDVVAYSYGTQIALEMIRARPRRVRAFISLLGTPERILDGLLPAWLANATMRTATRVLGERASAAVVGAALKLAATAPMAIWALSRATGYLRSPYRAFVPFFEHLGRLDARTWFRCVVDGHERGSVDVFADANREWFVAVIEGDRDFAAPRRVVRSWERHADFFVILRGVGHDGPTSHREEMTALVRDVYGRVDEWWTEWVDRKYSSASRRRSNRRLNDG